jgi:hypothetical protein
MQARRVLGETFPCRHPSNLKAPVLPGRFGKRRKDKVAGAAFPAPSASRIAMPQPTRRA